MVNNNYQPDEEDAVKSDPPTGTGGGGLTAPANSPTSVTVGDGGEYPEPESDPPTGTGGGGEEDPEPESDPPTGTGGGGTT